MKLGPIIDYMEATSEDGWLIGRCRSKDGQQNCLLGHLFDYGGNEACDLFEELYATSFMFFPVNDGTHPDYPQPTAKQRICAYLRDLQAGRQPTTQDHLAAYDAELFREGD